MNYLEQIREATQFLSDRGISAPLAGIVLGTGLGKLADRISISHSIAYGEIPHFPQATVESHKGRLLYGTINNIPVLAMQGRYHHYEGYSMQQITFPIRVMHSLGIKYLLLSNAAGGLNPAYRKTELVLLTDHINLQPENPLRGLNSGAYGPRFPDMSRPYDSQLCAAFQQEAKTRNITLHEGTYVAVPGPNLETRAEYRFLRLIGADIVGMSTVPEVIVANQLSIPCAAVSVITDECDPENLHPVDISEIIAAAEMADETLSLLFSSVIASLKDA